MTTRFNSVNLSKLPTRTLFKLENGNIVPGPIPLTNPEFKGTCRKCRAKYGPQKGHKHVYIWCRGCEKLPSNKEKRARLLDDNAAHCPCFAFGEFSTDDIDKMHVGVPGPCNHCAPADEWTPFACNPLSCLECIHKYQWDMLRLEGHKKLDLEVAVRANWYRAYRQKLHEVHIRATQMPTEGAPRRESKSREVVIPKKPVPPNQIAREARDAGRRSETGTGSSSGQTARLHSSSSTRSKDEPPESLKAILGNKRRE